MFQILLVFTYLGLMSPPPDPFDKYRTATAEGDATFATQAECVEFRDSEENRAAAMNIARKLSAVLGRDAQFMMECRCKALEREASQ